MADVDGFSIISHGFGTTAQPDSPVHDIVVTIEEINIEIEEF